jgi:hypothetical protein
MKPNIEKAIGRIFGNRSQAAVEAIITSAPVRHFITEADAAEVKRRADLVKQLANLPNIHEAGCAAAHKQAEQARAALASAYEAVNAASQAHQAAYGKSLSVAAVYERERSVLMRELESTCDARIYDFIGKCDDLFGQVRHVPPSIVGRADGKGIYFDGSKVDAALKALRFAQDKARPFLLQALSAAQIEQALQALAAELTVPLAAVGAKPPAVDAEVQLH